MIGKFLEVLAGTSQAGLEGCRDNLIAYESHRHDEAIKAIWRSYDEARVLQMYLSMDAESPERIFAESKIKAVIENEKKNGND